MASQPDKFAAGVGFHPSFCVSSDPDSPYRSVSSTAGQLYLVFGEADHVGLPCLSSTIPVVLFLRVLEHFILLLIPALTACVFAAKRGISNICLLGAIALAGIAFAGYAAFWVWLASPQAGYLFSLLLPPVCLLYLLKNRKDLTGSVRTAFRELALPGLLVFASSLLVLSTGYLYGGLHGRDPSTPFDTAATRFSEPLPLDNQLPFIFADQVARGRVLKPMFSDWHSSDRPPLQTGMGLLHYPYIPKSKQFGYQVLGVTLQCLVLFALWLYLRAFNLDPRALALVLTVTCFSGFFVVNSFYDWPKLLAATYMLAFSVLFLSDKLLAQLRKDRRVAVLSGGLLAFGMLSHGGSAFAALGLVIAFLLLRRKNLPQESCFHYALVCFTVRALGLIPEAVRSARGTVC